MVCPSRMVRLFIGVTAILALTLLAPPPAHGLTVTLTPSRTSAGPSTPVTFSGNAAGAPAGTDVTLQRRLGSGSWSTVMTGGTVSPSGTYTLTTNVATGAYSYRTKVGTSAYSPAMTVTGVYGRNASVPAPGSPFTFSARLPYAESRPVSAQYSTNGSNWTARRIATSNAAGVVAVRMYLVSTSYVRMVAPATSTRPAWAGPRSRVAVGADPVITRILNDTNAYRKAQGRAALKLHAKLNLIAGTWAYTMHQSCDFKHNPNYTAQYPSGWTRAAENIAAGQTYTGVVPAWIASSGHRANILGNYTHIGIGYHFGANCYDRYYVQNFAKF